MDNQIYQKIILKKEFSRLPKKDVEKVFAKFEKRPTSDGDKIKLSRDLLRKIYSVFTSNKLLGSRLELKKRDEEWFLKKHISTRERFPYYALLYKRLLGSSEKTLTIVDLGAGINGFSYFHFNTKSKYVGVEAVGQFVDLLNNYFEKKKISGQMYHLSLFDLNKIKDLIKKQRGEKIVFLFKTLDSLEMLEKDYSKKLLKGIVPLVDKVVVSFATRSLVRQRKFYANKKWLIDFVEDNFKVLDFFEFGSEKYLVFSKQ